MVWCCSEYLISVLKASHRHRYEAQSLPRVRDFRRFPTLLPAEFGTSVFRINYRTIIAVATTSTVLLYDTTQDAPLALMANLHCAHITDLAWYVCLLACRTPLLFLEFMLILICPWYIRSFTYNLSSRSSDAAYLMIASQDGYCSVVEFEPNELGVVLALAFLESFAEL